MKHEVIHVDTPTPCYTPENRDIFAAIIDITVAPGSGGSATKLDRLERIAAGICGGCPAREHCLDVHGDDFRLGVIAGKTDSQRASFYGQATA